MCEYFSAKAHMIPVGSQSIPRGTQEEMTCVTCRAIRAQERSKAIRGFRSGGPGALEVGTPVESG